MKCQIILLACLLVPGAVMGQTRPAADASRPALKYPDYTTPRRTVETFVWAVKSHNAKRIAECLYGRTPLEKQVSTSFAMMTAAMTNMLRVARAHLGRPPNQQPGLSASDRLNAMLTALPSATLVMKAKHATLTFKPTASAVKQGTLHFVKRGLNWKLDARAMFHLKEPGLTPKIIRQRASDERVFAHLLDGVTADVKAGKIKTWHQFSVDFETRILSETAKRQAEAQAKKKLGKSK